MTSIFWDCIGTDPYQGTTSIFWDCIGADPYQGTTSIFWDCIGADPYQGTTSIFWDCIGPDPYQGTTSVVLFCQPAGNDGDENKGLRPVFSGVPKITAGIKGFSPRLRTSTQPPAALMARAARGKLDRAGGKKRSRKPSNSPRRR
jgi:hypothetical protein